MKVDYDQAANGRRWCFVFQYPGKKQCFFGNAQVRLEATNQEVEDACWKAWEEVFPEDVERPRLVRLVPGMLVFIEEKGVVKP